MGPGSAAHHAAKGGALRSIRGTVAFATHLNNHSENCPRTAGHFLEPHSKTMRLMGKG
jgi:hypothetical protein